MLATKYGMIDIIELLLDRGADINRMDKVNHQDKITKSYAPSCYANAHVTSTPFHDL